MKKIIALTALCVLTASYASAAALATNTGSTAAISIFGGVDAAAAAAAPTALIRFSTGVNGIVNFTAAGTPPTSTAYLIATKHATGSKMFATTNSVTNIYWKQAGSGALTAEMLVVTTDAASNLVGNGWTSY